MSLIDTLSENLPADWKLDPESGVVSANLDTKGLVTVKIRPVKDGEQIRVIARADDGGDSVIGAPDEVTKLVERTVRAALEDALFCGWLDPEVFKELPRWAMVLTTYMLHKDHKEAQGRVDDVDASIKILQSERAHLQIRVDWLKSILGVLEA